MIGDYVLAQVLVWFLGWVAKERNTRDRDLTAATAAVLLLPFTFGLVYREMAQRPVGDRIGAMLLGLAEWAFTVSIVGVAIGQVRLFLY